MNKKTRLTKILDKESYSDVIHLYCCAKTSSQISREDFIIFKSFLAKMIDVQTEKDLTVGMERRWKTPHDYFKVMRGNRSDIELIKNLISYVKNGVRPFNFDFKKDYGFLI